MSDQIVTRQHIRAMAFEAYWRGCPRDGHNMNPAAPALVDWLAEWDRCHAAALRGALVEVSPP